MSKFDIKRGAAIIASVIAEGSQNVEAMGVNEVTMKFTLITPVVFQVGDWCTVYENKYVVYRKPEYTKKSEREHEYDLYLVHEFYKLQDSLLMGIDKNAILNEKVFDLTGNLQAFADLVLANANRNDTGWVLGTVDSTDAKTMQFDGENILASLNRIASEFETEFWIEGKTISFAKRLTNSGITLSYGENKGLISLTKGNKDANATIFTRLFVEGAERNLPSYTNYGFKRLQLPSANNGKVDNTSAIASFGVIEHYAKFDDIYPKHTGTITSVGDEFTFYDSALPFNINDQLLPGVTAYVAFQSGVLAGYNFDIASFDNATKKFIINENEDEKTTTLPNATLKPAVGDKYIVFDIQMPQTHIDTASNELLAKANELLAQGSDIDFNDAFSGNCDPLYFKRNSITPVLGQYARLFETNPAIDVTKRMSKISRDLQNPDKYDITFTDKIQVNTVVREYIKNIEETLVINETKDRTIINRDAVRRAAQRIDILRDDVFDPDGYFKDENIRAQTIEAIIATFGYNSGRFILEGAAFSLNVGGVANDYSFTSAKLIHFVYDVAGEYEWVIPALTSSFVDSNSGYYVYAKCSKTALTGTWVVNNSKLQVDNETGYYTLLIGRVYPVVSGKREIDLLYGVTNIVGNRIQTGIIQDLAGTNFWNLDTGEMRVSGQITVGAGSNVYNKTEVDGTIQAINNQIIALDGQLANYASDGVLNGIAEKQPIKIAYDAAANEVEDLKTQAAALGVSSLDYNAAFINLQNFVLPLLADLTSVSVVDGVQLRDKFNYYGAQKSLLVKNIQAANVNNISRVENYSEINLLAGSKPGKHLEPSEAYTSNNFSVTAGKTYSVAVNTTVSGSTGRVIGWVHPQWAWYFSPPQNNTYGVAQTRTVTFNAPSTADNVIVQLQNDNAAGGVVVNWITVVEGGKPMLHWQPNIAETSVTLYNSTNLLKNSNFARGFDDWGLDGSGHTIETDPVYGNVAKLAYGQYIHANLYSGDTTQVITVSFYAKGSAGAILRLLSYAPFDIKYPTITTSWERYYVTLKVSSGWALGMQPMSAGMTIWLANIQIEAGAAATAYKVADGDLLKISNEAKLTAENADEAADALSGYVDGAFKDGVIEAAEAKAIEKYTNIVNETYEQLVNSYNILYNDALLTGSAKTNLASAKTNLDTSKNALLSAIANAIADGKTTSAEKAAVDSAYTDFKTKIGAYTTASDNAYKSITDALNVKATEAQTAANSKSTHYTSKPTSYKAGDTMTPFAAFTEGGKTFKMGVMYFTETTSATFNKDHWNEKLIYTDDTIANSRGKNTIGLTFPSSPLVDDLHFETSGRKWWKWNGTAWVDTGLGGLNYLYQALGMSTEITGGLTLTNIMGVRNESGNVTSYVNGLNGSNGIAFAAGVTNFGAYDEAQIFAIKHNGDIVIQKSGSKKLEFIASTGALTISGTVNATAGSIGGFTIESDKFRSNDIGWNKQTIVLDKANNTLKFYSGKLTSDNTEYGTLLPDIDIGIAAPGSNSFQGGALRFYSTTITDGDRDRVEISGNGIGVGTSNMKFIYGTASNASFVSLLRRDSGSSTGVSAAIVGLDTIKSGVGITVGGYFSSIMTGQLFIGYEDITDYGTYYLTKYQTNVLVSGGSTANSYIMLHAGLADGGILLIRNNCNGSIYVNRTGSFNIIDNSGTSQTSITLEKGKTIMLWKGETHYYVLFVN